MPLVTVLCQGNYEGRHPEGIKYYKEFPSKLLRQVPYCDKCKKVKTKYRKLFGKNRRPILR